MTITQREELRSVLDQLETLNAGVLKVPVADLSDVEVEGWLRSERLRLHKLFRVMGDQNA